MEYAAVDLCMNDCLDVERRDIWALHPQRRFEIIFQVESSSVEMKISFIVFFFKVGINKSIVQVIKVEKGRGGN